jgi:hypothetical protein
MRGGRVRFGTFDAERHWRPADLATLPGIPDRHADRVVSAMDEVLCALCEPADLLITGRPLPPGFLGALAGAGLRFAHRVAPGDEAEPVEGRIAGAGWSFYGRRIAPYAVLPGTVPIGPATLPPAAVVAEVNSKSFSSRLAGRLGLAGAGVVVESTAELARAAAGPSVVKDPYGVAGRGAVTVESGRTRDAVVRHLDRQAARGRRVEFVVQPLFDVAAEFSAHVDVTESGAVTWIGVTSTRGEGFGYGGSLPAPAELLRELATHGYRETITTIAGELARCGYHGPVCVDSLRLADGTVVPVLEINARLSMGRIRLELARRFPDRSVELRAHHVTIPLPFSPDDVFRALGRQRLLLRGEGTGLLPLSANTLLAPRGRLYYATVAHSGPEHRALRHALEAALTDAGLPALRGRRAA